MPHLIVEHVRDPGPVSSGVAEDLLSDAAVAAASEERTSSADIIVAIGRLQSGRVVPGGIGSVVEERGLLKVVLA